MTGSICVSGVTHAAACPLGRLASVTTPQDQASGDATEKFSYSVPGPNPSTGVYPPAAVTTQTLREDGTYGVDVQISDGMGQERQEQSTPANDGAGRVITDTFYNSDGWAVKVHNPYYDSTTAPGNHLVPAHPRRRGHSKLDRDQL